MNSVNFLLQVCNFYNTHGQSGLLKTEDKYMFVVMQ